MPVDAKALLARLSMRKGLLYRWLHLLLPAGLLFAAFSIRIGGFQTVEELQFKVFDAYQRARPRPYKPLPVRILDLDDETLSRLGQWPWPRTQVARLVRRLAELGAASISFDVVFAEPDRTSPAALLKNWSDAPELAALRAKAATLPDNDRALGKAMKDAGNVVAGFVLTGRDTGKYPAYPMSFAVSGQNPADFLPAYGGAITNVDPIDKGAAGHGCFTADPDSDGIIRRAPLLFRCDRCGTSRLLPALSAEALRVAQGAAGYAVKSQGASGVLTFGEHSGIAKVKIGQFVIPTDPLGRVWIHYTRPLSERTIPIWKLFEKSFNPELINGAIVFVGTSAEGLKDQRATPLHPAAPGVEIHAQVVEQVLSQDFLQRPDLADTAEILFLLFLGLPLILLLPLLGAAWCATIGVAAIAGAFAFSWHAYASWQWLLDPVFPSLAVIVVYIASSLISYLKTELEKKHIRGAFSRYMHPKLVEELARHPEKLRLGGETRPMTILFCDIRGFTTISEQYDAHGLTHVINRFLTPMTEVIMERLGYIDKYIGDCIMAFWNAPLDDPRHAANACSAALTMIAGLGEVNRILRVEAEAAGKKFHELHIGVGLNTGDCCVGNMGSDQRFNYSVLGDDVNLASRLEGQSKSYGVDIVIGPKTRELAPDFAALELDLIKVKGKTKPVRIFSLLGDNALRTGPKFRELAEAHGKMLDAYRAQDWDEAEKRLKESIRASDGFRLQVLHRLYEGRIAAYRAAPPGKDWDGAYTALTK